MSPWAWFLFILIALGFTYVIVSPVWEEVIRRRRARRRHPVTKQRMRRLWVVDDDRER